MFWWEAGGVRSAHACSKWQRPSSESELSDARGLVQVARTMAEVQVEDSAHVNLKRERVTITRWPLAQSA